MKNCVKKLQILLSRLLLFVFSLETHVDTELLLRPTLAIASTFWKQSAIEVKLTQCAELSLHSPSITFSTI